ncbi:McbB family protein [Lysinibacillus sp. NPDC093197]|uniref:McbB family protein n=1 Tax=Lysinibacillus sp. NPDC093197 TaxID=3364132 RepID=UPI0037FF7302
MYEINPYLLYSINKEKEKQHIVQTKSNSMIIKSNPLISFLSFLEENELSCISKFEIYNFFEENKEFSDRVISFLCDNDIFKTKVKKDLDFSNIAIYSNDKKNEVEYLFRMVFDEMIVLNTLEDEKKLNEIGILFILFNPFNLKNLKGVVEKLKEYENLVYKVIFPYNNSIYISNYYSKKWNNPCPLCFFDSLEAQLRGNINGYNNPNFQMMIDLIYKENIEFEYDGLISERDYLPLMNIILRDITNEKIELKIDKVYRISLKDYYVNTDFSYYWEMCDCYE